MTALRVATYNIHKGVQGLGPNRRLEIHNLGHAVEQFDADIRTFVLKLLADTALRREQAQVLYGKPAFLQSFNHFDADRPGRADYCYVVLLTHDSKPYL